METIVGKPIIIKRTNVKKCLEQVYMRNYGCQKLKGKEKRTARKLLWNTYQNFHTKHKRELNQFIAKIIKVK